MFYKLMFVVNESLIICNDRFIIMICNKYHHYLPSC